MTVNTLNQIIYAKLSNLLIFQGIHVTKETTDLPRAGAQIFQIIM